MSKVSIRPLTTEELDAVLPLIRAYQLFYEAADPNDERNREFFARFIAPSEVGMLLGAWDGDELLGHACLYWHFSSTTATTRVLMNDLYVVEGARGKGVGRSLIDASLDVARERGCSGLEWMTATDNVRAQRLYDSTGAEKDAWFGYSLEP